MSYEFKVSFGETGEELLLHSLAERLLKTGRYEIEEILNEELKLRFSGSLRRPKWPEDIVLKKHGAGLIAQFHIGDASQRASLLSDLQEIYTQHGNRIEIEEL